MGLTVLPAVGGSLGPEKVDEPGATPGLDDRLYGSEWNAAAQALEEVCEQVGLPDGSTPGSIEARLQNLDEISSTEGSYEARVQTTAIPGSGTSVLGSTDGAKYSQVTTSTTGSSTLAKSKSVDGAWEVESEESVSSSSSAAHRTTTVTDGSSVAAQVAQITAGTVTAGSQATRGAVDAILAAIASAVAGQITATVTDGTKTVGISGSTSGYLGLYSDTAIIPVNESGHEALPAGITSIVQGFDLLSGLLDGNQLDAGTWTPTITPISNVTSATQLGNGIHFKIGSVRVCSCTIDVLPSSTSLAEVTLTTPSAVDFTVYTQALGIVAGAQAISGHCLADTATDVIRMFTSSSASSRRVTVIAWYTE